MYSYYALRAAKVHIPRNVAMAVTSSQLLQMIVGIYINWSAYRLKNALGSSCSVSYENIAASFLMYLSYFILFGKFFFDAYINSKSAIHKPTKLKAKAETNGHLVVSDEEKKDGKKTAVDDEVLRHRRPPAQSAH